MASSPWSPIPRCLYKVTSIYAPKNGFGVLWNDLALGIQWPIAESEALLSAKDKVLPRLADLPAYFTYK